MHQVCPREPVPLSSGQYAQAFQTHPNNPLHSLCVGLTFFHMASQKYVTKRHALVLQVRTPSSGFAPRSDAFSLTCVCFPGFLLPVAIRGAAWRVSGEHVQPGPSAAPDRPHTFGHTLLPEGADAAGAEAGGSSGFCCGAKLFASCV